MAKIPVTIHGTCVYWHGSGILIIGPSGSGKSQLALALMGEAMFPAELVADDRVVMTVNDEIAVASAPEALSGKIERFGMGIETHRPRSSAAVALVVELMERDEIMRMPDAADLSWDYQGVSVAKLILPTQPANPVASIRATLRRVGRYD
ncbi:MAG: HPr kinase/phosphatase C-terminal domain-containing protein [Hyphomicrobiales bacterium]